MIEFLLFTMVFALATWLGGWWTIVVVAVVWSLWRRQSPWRAGFAAGLSWIALLTLIPLAPLLRLTPRLGGVIGLPGWAMLLLPPLFAFLLGWSSARLTISLRRSPESQPDPAR